MLLREEGDPLAGDGGPIGAGRWGAVGSRSRTTVVARTCTVRDWRGRTAVRGGTAAVARRRLLHVGRLLAIGIARTVGWLLRLAVGGMLRGRWWSVVLVWRRILALSTLGVASLGWIGLAATGTAELLLELLEEGHDLVGCGEVVLLVDGIGRGRLSCMCYFENRLSRAREKKREIGTSNFIAVESQDEVCCAVLS